MGRERAQGKDGRRYKVRQHAGPTPRARSGDEKADDGRTDGVQHMYATNGTLETIKERTNVPRDKINSNGQAKVEAKERTDQEDSKRGARSEERIQQARARHSREQ